MGGKEGGGKGDKEEGGDGGREERMTREREGE